MATIFQQRIGGYHGNSLALLFKVSAYVMVACLAATAQGQQDSLKNLFKGAPTSKIPMATIPAGEFTMGNPEWKDGRESQGPLHRVRISKFLLGKHEVTQSQWKAVMKSNPSEFSAQGAKKEDIADQDTGNFPVENVTWYDAVLFCNRLSESEGLDPYYQLDNKREEEFTFLGKTEILIRYDVKLLGGNGYRLPTEAEWEYACRAGTTTRYSFGDACNGTQANTNGKYTVGTDEKGPVREQPLPVGSFKANAFGLYDMHGNVWEWCMDEHNEKAYQGRGKLTENPLEAREVIVGGENTSHVLRGGDWGSGALAATSYGRYSWSASGRNNDTGFRVARSIAR